MSKPQILLCTVGTSLYTGRAKPGAPPPTPAAILAEVRGLSPSDRPCGAEINSIDSLLRKGHVADNVGLFFFHSDTDDGRAIGGLLRDYFRERGHSPSDMVQIDGLNNVPRSFRTHGLRNLARQICRVIREYGAVQCAINATGGFKAQVAIAVLLGQALGVPVYYKHETFDEIIAFPPLPVALDFEVWMKASGLLGVLERSAEPIRRDVFADETWDDRYESLVETIDIDGAAYVELSPAGQIFHEMFRERFRTARDQVLPANAAPSAKQAPMMKGNEGHMLKHEDKLRRFLERITGEVGPVMRCRTHYYNPDLPKITSFRLTKGEVEGIYSEGGMTIKFWVDSTATTEGQKNALVAVLNEWLEGNPNPEMA